MQKTFCSGPRTCSDLQKQVNSVNARTAKEANSCFHALSGQYPKKVFRAVNRLKALKSVDCVSTTTLTPSKCVALLGGILSNYTQEQSACENANTNNVKDWDGHNAATCMFCDGSTAVGGKGNICKITQDPFGKKL